MSNTSIRNPLSDIEEDISTMPISMTFFEKIGLVSVILIFISIIMFAMFSLVIDIIEVNFFSILFDATIILIFIAAVYFLVNLLRKKIVTDMLIDTAFQYGVYSRLRPVFDNIAEHQVGIDVLAERMIKLDMKMDTILKEGDVSRSGGVGGTEGGVNIWEEPITMGTSVKFMIKIIFNIILTMAMFMFMVSFNLGGITPYAVLSIFVIWWLFFTNEYDLWRNNDAWLFVFLPVIAVPMIILIIANFINYNVMLAMLYVATGIYSFIYYTWSIYTVTGSVPFIRSKHEETEERAFFSARQKGFLEEFVEEVENKTKIIDFLRNVRVKKNKNEEYKK